MVCIVITQNGLGQAWRFDDLEAARLHPIAQMGDVYATTSEELYRSYIWFSLEKLYEFVSTVRGKARYKDVVLEASKTLNKRAKNTELKAMAEEAWESLQKAPRPPKDAAELMALIRADRVAMEGKISHVHREPWAEPKRGNVTPIATKRKVMSENTEKKARAPRIKDSTVIRLGTDKDGNTYGPDNNPRRAGAKGAGTFALYRDGMTVAEAKAAGVKAVDIRWDSSHGYDDADGNKRTFITLDNSASEGSQADNEAA